MNVPALEALLDTDTLSLYGRGDPHVQARAAEYQVQHDRLAFSELTRYEITRGLLRIGSVRRLGAFDALCRASRVVPSDAASSARAAHVWADLINRGVPIGEIDVLIAGVALAHRPAVVTRNTAHFSRVPGLTVIDWTQ